MLPFFTELYGNAASISHRFGWEAGEAVARARQQVASAIGAEAKEIVFTSGATESDNLAIKGVALAMKRKGNHLVTSAAEHKAVLDTMKRLGREGWEVTVVPCDETGRVAVDSIAAVLCERTILVSIMAANNEVGTLNPIREIGRLCHDRGVIFHTDATQAVGKVPLGVLADNVDLLSLSGHKMYGPKGIGALYVRRRDPQVRLVPQLDGGGHERGMRSGTPAVPLIVGLGAAAELAARERPDESRRLLDLRECLHAGIAERVSDVCLNGHPTERLPGNLNLSFAYLDGEALDDGHARRRGEFGRGVHRGQPRAQPCPSGHGAERGDGAGQPAVWPGAVLDLRRNRICHRCGGGRGGAPAGSQRGLGGS